MSFLKVMYNHWSSHLIRQSTYIFTHLKGWIYKKKNIQTTYNNRTLTNHSVLTNPKANWQLPQQPAQEAKLKLLATSQEGSGSVNFPTVVPVSNSGPTRESQNSSIQSHRTPPFLISVPPVSPCQQLLIRTNLKPSFLYYKPFLFVTYLECLSNASDNG